MGRPDYEALLRSSRRRPMADPAALPVKLDYGRDAIERILPHRDPFLLVDRLTGLDREAGLISGERTLDASLPVFAGHFPGQPVYPGCLEVEMIGQLGLCLTHFLLRETDGIGPGAYPPLDVRATKIIGAQFLAPARPGDRVVLLARLTEHDDFLGAILGQALVGDEVACVAACEVAFL